MNPINLAMRHPITTTMMVVALVAGGTFALLRMRVDIFPPINQPQIYIVCSYGGMDPSQMEGLIVNQFELAFQYVDGVRDVESRCIQQVAIIKLSFFPETDMAKAMASVVSQVSPAAQVQAPPKPWTKRAASRAPPTDSQPKTSVDRLMRIRPINTTFLEPSRAVSSPPGSAPTSVPSG